MNTEKIRTNIVTGFMDAGKTSCIQDLIFRDYFHKREHGRTLILVFEDGETAYDTERLLEFRTEVVFWEGGDFAAFLSDSIETYLPDRIFVEANCMMPELMEALKAHLDVISITMLIDASTLELYYLNMLQLLQDMVKLADPVIINRAETKEQLQPFGTAFRLMNQRAGFLWESPMGYHEKVFGNALPFDRMQPEIALTENDYPHFYLDAMEYPEHYEGKILELDVQAELKEEQSGNSSKEDAAQSEHHCCRVGRTVMTCCMNDIQFLSFPLQCEGVLPSHHSYIHLKASTRIITDPVYRRRQLQLVAQEMHTIPFPSKLILSVRSGN